MRHIYILVLLIFFIAETKHANAQIPVTFYTTMGTFTVQLEDKKAPITVANFVKLVNEKFYDSVIFHRVVKSFVIQGGDPTGTGNGGPGYTIADEFDSMSNVQKTIGMANEGIPHTGGSQFYINLVNNVYLDHKYSVFGKVTSNFVVVQNIGKVVVDSTNRPLTPVVMDSVRIGYAVGIAPTPDVLSEVSIFPDPVTTESVITFNSPRTTPAEVCIYDQLGKCIQTTSVSLQQGGNTISFETLGYTGFNAGIYFIVIQQEGFVVKKRFVVRN
jgi:peptidylprolyl isomerase